MSEDMQQCITIKNKKIRQRRIFFEKYYRLNRGGFFFDQHSRQ